MKNDYFDASIEMPEDIQLFCREHKISKREIERKIEIELIEKEYELSKKHKKSLPKKLHIFINYVYDRRTGHKIIYPERNFKNIIMKTTVFGKQSMGFIFMKKISCFYLGNKNYPRSEFE